MLEKLTPFIKEHPNDAALEGTLFHCHVAKVVTAFFDHGIKEISSADFSCLENDVAHLGVVLNYLKDTFSFFDPNTCQDRYTSEKLMYIRKRPPAIFGTPDITVLYKNELHIVDYKHGKSVKVSPYRNQQLMFYAYSALKYYKIKGNVNVFLTIIQPRASKKAVNTWSTSAKHIKRHAKKIISVAKLIHENSDKVEFKTGTHCRFCRAKPNCQKYAEEIFEPYVSPENDESLEQLYKVYQESSDVIEYIEKCKEQLLRRLDQGEQLDGVNVTLVRNTKKWINEDEALIELKQMFSEELLTKRVMKSPNELVQQGVMTDDAINRFVPTYKRLIKQC